MPHLTYVFCHGLNGWGQYDEQYKKSSYWGGKSGNVAKKLCDLGYDTCEASVAPQGSAWDRACELYAQIAGVRVDYGEAHSREYWHDRFGRDFSGEPLIPAWDDGLVNTVSARAPFGAPQKPLDRSDIQRGVWNVFPDLRVDHGYFQGGFIRKCDPFPFYLDLVKLLSSLQ